MQRLLDGEQAAIRQQVRAILSRPSFRYLPPTASVAEQRDAAYRWCKELAADGIGALALPREFGGQDDFAKFMAAFETIAFHDISLTIKFTVQFGLWLGSVLLLGSEKHHRKYLCATGSFDLPGCFAMTEIGHGSNVRDVETLARYDQESGEFVITSPTFASGKNYIGNAACHGRAAAVFAQLETGGRRYGVHAFVVPIRDEDGKCMPGVRIEDNGPKMGENGVDNGRVWFDGVRVDRTALLDRFGQVAADGTYHSEIRGDGARFFTMLSALVGGRISIAAAAISSAKSGLAIAVRYAARRRQFRAPGASEETRLIDYPTHQRRLVPLVANAYALDLAHKALVRRRVAVQAGGDPAGTREVERMAAGLKAWATWNTTRSLQICREACGGEGYISENRIPALKADTDIFTTFEGDNTVLMLWIGRNLLAAPPDDIPARETDAGNRGPELDEPGDFPRLDFLRLFIARERMMLDELRDAFARHAAAGEDSHQAAARHSLALVRLAFAHVERAVLEAFGNAVKSCPDDRDNRDNSDDTILGEVLGALRDLFALALLEEHRGWFLENSYITAEVSRGLPARVERQCARLAPHAVALVDAFGIPAQCLAAPIAFLPR